MSAPAGSGSLVLVLPWATALLQLAAVACALRLASPVATRRVWWPIAAGLSLLALHSLLKAFGGGAHPASASQAVVDALAASILTTALARAAWSPWSTRADAGAVREEALETAERLDALFRQAPDAIFLCTTEGAVLDANESAASATGLAREQLVGLPSLDFLKTIALLPSEVGDASTAAGGQATCELKRPDGRRVSLDVRGRTLELAGEHFLLVSARDITERKRLEAQALAHESRFGFILDNLPAYIWTTDHTLTVTSARGRGLAALGVKAENIVGRNIVEIFPGKSLREMLVALHRRTFAGERVTFRRRFLGRMLEIVMTRLADDAGSVEVIGIVLDVTDRVTAESEARAQDLRLTEILDHAPVMAVIKDLDLRITYVNREWEAVTGIERATALGNSAQGILPPEVARIVEAHDREVLTRGKAEAFVEEVGRGTRRRSFSTVKFPLHGPDGEPSGMCTLLREVTDQMAAVDELRHRTLLLDEAQSMARLGSWEWDLVTGRRYWSFHLFALLGLDPALGAEAGYDAYLASVPDEDREEFMAHTLGAITGPSTTSIEHRSRFADGSMHWLRAHSHIDRDDAGVATRVYGFAQDITAEREASGRVADINERLEERVAERTAQIEEAIKELSTFSYAVSHDLRQPLRAIAGYLAMMEEDVGTSLTPTTREYLDQVQVAARRMDATIDALLSLTRLTRATLHRDEIDASAMVHEIATELGVADPSRNVHWQIEPGVRVRADRGLFRVVLQNLLGNAFKFTRERADAHIAFGCERRDGAAVLFVRDDGAGFESSSARRLFQPFQRMHDARDFEGTGIGLATVARILHRHGGWIRADSRVGLGATFRFHLPEFAETADSPS